MDVGRLNNMRESMPHDLELVSIVRVLNNWRHYLMARIFELRTDHRWLKYQFVKWDLNVRVQRWLEFIYGFDFEIKHIKGKKKTFVDALI